MTRIPYPSTEWQACFPRRWSQTKGANQINDWPLSKTRNSTTSFLTATTLVYAIGAGITAAAGTRLALQLILDKGLSPPPLEKSQYYIDSNTAKKDKRHFKEITISILTVSCKYHSSIWFYDKNWRGCMLAYCKYIVSYNANPHPYWWRFGARKIWASWEW